MEEPATIYQTAINVATRATADTVDTKYGCGSSFITIKGNTAFARWAKKQGYTHRDAYYGTILSVETPFSGTLENEAFKEAVSSSLSAQGVHAFCHTRLD